MLDTCEMPRKMAMNTNMMMQTIEMAEVHFSASTVGTHRKGNMSTIHSISEIH